MLSDLKARLDGSVGIALEQVGITATDLSVEIVFGTNPEETIFSFAEFCGEEGDNPIEGFWLFEVGQVCGLWNDGQAGVGDLIGHELGIGGRGCLIQFADNDLGGAGNLLQEWNRVRPFSHGHQVSCDAADLVSLDHGSHVLDEIRFRLNGIGREEFRNHEVGDG